MGAFWKDEAAPPAELGRDGGRFIEYLLRFMDEGFIHHVIGHRAGQTQQPPFSYQNNRRTSLQILEDGKRIEETSSLHLIALWNHRGSRIRLTARHRSEWDEDVTHDESISSQRQSNLSGWYVW